MTQTRIWGTLDPFIEGYTGEKTSERLVGRNVANYYFLSQLFRQDPFSEYHFFLGSAEQSEALTLFCQKNFAALLRSERIRIFPRIMLPKALAQGGYHCFHLSDCMNYPAYLARLRNLCSPEIFPITSMTHSLSYARFTKDFLTHLWPGKTARDVVVASSETAQQVVREYFEHLRRGYFLDPVKFSAPEVAVIPLGVDTRAYAPADAADKAGFRRQLGVSEERTLLLLIARLSHMSKLDVLPLLRAMQRMLRSGENLAEYCLILAGAAEESSENDMTLQTYEELAANLGLELRIVKNPSNTEKKRLLAAADVFLSPADNLQETFGLTLLEAGACGLPVLASDFDGYRDLVEPDRTGFLIPTLGPGQSSLFDALSGVLYDNQQHLLMAQQLVVDVPAMAEALIALHHKPDLRRQMGQAARERICGKFTWEHVLDAYCELWEELWHLPVDENAVRASAHPLEPDYTRIFGSYPTRQMSGAVLVRWSATGQAVYRKQDYPVLYGGLEPLFAENAIRAMLVLARKECRADTLVGRLAEMPEMSSEQAEALVLWALKQDLLEYRLAPETPPD